MVERAWLTQPRYEWPSQQTSEENIPTILKTEEKIITSLLTNATIVTPKPILDVSRYGVFSRL